MEEELDKNEQTPAPNGAKGFAIASLVLGIVGLVLFCVWYLSVPCAVLAIIFSIVAKKKGGKNGMATAGLVLGIVTLVILVLILILAAIGITALNNLNAINTL